MLNEERHQLIRKQLSTNSIIKIKDLMKLTDSSESTIRRDLQDLEKQNYLIRIHGGAKRILSLNDEPSVQQKALKNSDLKDSIAKAAISEVKSGDMIFLDSGTTIQKLIPYLQQFKDIFVVTNSIDNAIELANYKINSFMISGKIKHSTRALVGADSINRLINFQFDIAFLGANGFDLTYGVTTPDIEEATLKRTALLHSQNIFVLADKSKFREVSSCKFAELNEVTIITNSLDINEDEKSKLNNETYLMEVNK